MPATNVNATATPTRHCITASLSSGPGLDVDKLTESPASVTELYDDDGELYDDDDVMSTTELYDELCDDGDDVYDDDDVEANVDDDAGKLASQFAALTVVPIIKQTTANVPASTHYQRHCHRLTHDTG